MSKPRTQTSRSLSRPPNAAVILMTLAINVLGLTIPVACSIVFNRVLPNPGSATLPVLAGGAVVLALAEGLLRYARAAVLARTGADVAGLLTHRLLRHVLVSHADGARLPSSRSLEYLAAIGQLKERYNGQALVSVVELIFLPIIVIVVFMLSTLAGACVLGCLALFAAVTTRDALSMERHMRAANRDNERRYDFLFDTLSAMHSLKALGIEDHLLRHHERLQAKLTAENHELSLVVGRLLVAGPVASQLMLAAMLAFGAAAVGGGDLTLGGVSALVLLAGRVMAPLQRAVFLIVQMRDVGAAEDVVAKVFAQPIISTPLDDLDVVNEGRLEIEAVSHRAGEAAIEDVTVALAPGEALALSGPEEASSLLLRLVAGVEVPDAGVIRLNGAAPTSYPEPLLNRAVGYVPAHGLMFRGTIRDNITRFGEVSVDEAMSVAAIMEIDGLINELPRGLDTELVGSDAELIAPGLRQQLAILRAVSTRPRVILLDNADRGLDRTGYARLNRFVGKLVGQATFVIVSDDANLRSYASRRMVLAGGRLNPVGGGIAQARTAYRELTL